MDFRRSAARRRRVMREDVLDAGHSADHQSSAVNEFQRYNVEEVLRNQPLLLDGFPKRFWTNALAGLVLIFLAVGLLFGHYHRIVPFLAVTEPASGERAAKLDALWSLNHASSLSQLFWTGCGLASLFMVYQLYQLRRHREDDYSGTYQIWLWSLPVATAIAVMGVPSLRSAVMTVFETIIPAAYQTATWGWVALILGITTAGMLLRLVREVVEAKLAMVALAMGAFLFIVSSLAAAAVSFSWNLGPLGQLPSDLSLSLCFAATVCWSISLLTYLGFVCRDVLGLVDHTAAESSPAALADEPTAPKKQPKRIEPTAEIEASPDSEEVAKVTKRRRKRRQAA